MGWVQDRRGWIADRLVLAGLQEVQARLEVLARADRAELGEAERAGPVVVVVRHDVGETDVRPQEDRLALGLGLARLEELKARGEEVARADLAQLREGEPAAAVLVMVLEDVLQADVRPQEHRLALGRRPAARPQEGDALVVVGSADRGELDDAEGAATVVVVVLHHVREADVRPEEDRLALRLRLARLEEVHALLEKVGAHRGELRHAELARLVLIAVREDVGEPYVRPQEHGLALRLLVVRLQEREALVEELRAHGRELGHAEVAGVVLVAVLEDVDEADVRAQEDVLALRLQVLARLQEGHALVEELRADLRELLHRELERGRC